MATSIVAILHPGEMGVGVAAAAAAAGHRVRWASDGRSDATRARARAAGLEATGSVANAVATAEVVISVCPPHAAEALADAVAGAGFRGLYLDANAIAPATAARVRARVEEAGARYVDGGIIGPPPHAAGTTRLYLSGAEASRLAPLFEGTPLAPVVLDGGPFAASALKMAYAAWTKGSAALLAVVHALARASRVDDALLAEWALSQPGLAARAEGSITASAPKAWRWVAEMREIAASAAGAGLPDGFHAGAAEVYERLAQFKDCRPPPELERVVAALLAPSRDDAQG